MSIEAFERLSEKKQAAILGAGVKEFSHKTYTEASTDAITIQSNISKGLLKFKMRKAPFLPGMRRLSRRAPPRYWREGWLCFA